MKTSSYFEGKVKENFEKFFDKRIINQLSKSSRFVQRKGAKISPFAFVMGLIESCFTRCGTYLCMGSSYWRNYWQESVKAGIIQTNE